jgi:hypothetical protein
MEIIAALIGVVAGAAGYWIAAFWMQPVLKYRELRLQVYGDFVFYAQVVNADGLNERMQELHEERVMANRRRAADLAACLTELPSWYAWWLRRKGQEPERAARNLVGYSNTFDQESAHKVAGAIKRALGFKEVSE